MIRLEFLYFNLEYHPHCSSDFVEVRYSLSLPSYKFCGQKLPSTVESSGRRMWISFESNERTIGGGFEAKFRAIKGTTIRNGKSILPVNGIIVQVAGSSSLYLKKLN